MTIAKLHLAFFSPGGTTEKVVRGVADGIRDALPGLPVETIDLLSAETRRPPAGKIFSFRRRFRADRVFFA